VATALGCSHGLACSIMHDRLKFRKVCTQWVLRELKGQEKMNQVGMSLQHLLHDRVCPCNISYSMQMKETICLTGLLLGMTHVCITTNLNQSIFQCNGNIPVHPQPKSLRLHHRLGRLCLPCFEIIREYC
jgi:hypothetical protein